MERRKGHHTMHNNQNNEKKHLLLTKAQTYTALLHHRFCLPLRIVTGHCRTYASMLNMCRRSDVSSPLIHTGLQGPGIL